MTAIQDIKPPVPQPLEGIDWEALWPSSQKHLVDWWVRLTTYATELEDVAGQTITRDRYRQYLRTPEWRARRDATLRFYRNQCAWRCGKPATQVHHFRSGYRHLGRERVGDLVALCDSCHERHHDVLVPVDTSIPTYRALVEIWPRLSAQAKDEINKLHGKVYGSRVFVR